MAGLGVCIQKIGEFASGNFYIPLKKIKNSLRESGRLINRVVSWIIAPWIVAFSTVPILMDILIGAPLSGNSPATVISKVF